MKCLYLFCLFQIGLLISACSPIAAIGAIGTTVNNAAYNAAERDLNNPANNKGKALEVATANMNLGVEYLRQGNYEAALRKLDKAVQAKPDFAPVYNVRGLLYQQLGEMGEAEKNFKRAIRLDPDDASTFNNYGSFLCSRGRREEALDAFLSAAKNPFYDSPEIALTNAGLCSLNDDTLLAKRYFNEALSQNAAFAPALLQMASIAYDNNEFESAHAYFRRYKANARQTPKSLLLGIKICHQLGYDDDVSSYALLLKNTFPDTDEARLLQEFDL